MIVFHLAYDAVYWLNLFLVGPKWKATMHSELPVVECGMPIGWRSSTYITSHSIIVWFFCRQFYYYLCWNFAWCFVGIILLSIDKGDLYRFGLVSMLCLLHSFHGNLVTRFFFFLKTFSMTDGLCPSHIGIIVHIFFNIERMCSKLLVWNCCSVYLYLAYWFYLCLFIK